MPKPQTRPQAAPSRIPTPNSGPRPAAPYAQAPAGKLSSDPAAQSGLGILLRLTWLMFGNVLLMALAIAIAERQSAGFLTVVDAAFWTLVGGLALARYVDITRMKGQTASGEPATIGHWRRYLVTLLPLSVVVWGAAHAVAYFRG
ncbi:MAG: hypothetical protein E4H01_16360 [Lysobacterales bacterium]|nr:MAG: hypothetical protein E4H01_16360 [Xanthomonadales bacterium]